MLARIRIDPSKKNIPPLLISPLTPPHTHDHERKPTPPNPHPSLFPLDIRIELHLRRPFTPERRLFAEQGGGGFLLVDRIGVTVEGEVVGWGREGVEGFERGTEVVPAKGEVVCRALADG